MNFIAIYQSNEKIFKFLSSIILILIMVSVIVSEWLGFKSSYLIASMAIVFYLFVSLNNLTISRKIFIILGIFLILLSFYYTEEALVLITDSLIKSSFVVAFFLSLQCLRKAAASSPGMERCGKFLAEQKTNIRYLSLTFGGHIFGVLLSFGSISLLGSLAEKGSQQELDPELRKIKRKSMLIAVQRGFIAMTCWSPLTYSIAITTSIIPGSSWNGAAFSCVISALILIFLGWIIDSRNNGKNKKQILENPPLQRDSWVAVLPLFFIFTSLLGIIFLMQNITNLNAVPVVMLVVPLYSLIWISIQNSGSSKKIYYGTKRKVLEYVKDDINDYKSELVILIMAAFIGIMASSLINILASDKLSFLESLSPILILVSIVWIMPLFGQIGMNPILSVYLIGPLIPNADILGISPNSIILALTAGWALSGISSPYTASTLLIAKLGKVSPLHAGLNWNGWFTIIGGLLLSIWIIIANEFIVK